MRRRRRLRDQSASGGRDAVARLNENSLVGAVATRLRRRRHPAQLIVIAFAAAILVGTLLLMLPFARSDPGGAPPLTALFTATSAVCVTGLSVVDTPTYWSHAGK